jgi:cation-transporting P-type ATPase 13A2
MQNKTNKGECIALAVRTGFASAKGELIKSILYPTPDRFKFNQEIRFFLCIMMFLTIVLWATTLPTFIKYFSPLDCILESLDVFTLPIPPELPVAMTIGVIFALRKLKKKGIHCINPSRINVGGWVSIMVLDKTGTLTEEGLSVNTCKIYDQNTFLPSTDWSSSLLATNKVWLDRDIYQEYKNDSILKYWEWMASSHSITLYRDNPVGDILEIEMFKATNWIMVESNRNNFCDDLNWGHALYPPEIQASDIKEDDESHYHLFQVHKFDFSSELQRMSVIAKSSFDSEYIWFTKGSPEQIYELCNKNSLPNDYFEVLTSYTQKGRRVIALAYRYLDNFNESRPQDLDRADFEKDLKFLGLLVMSNELKNVTKNCINNLKQGKLAFILLVSLNF